MVNRISQTVAVILLLMAQVSFGVDLPDLDQPLPMNPDIRTGQLENGLTYYLQHNAKPENRADLRLVVNAGSVLEDDDQQGLAHLLEHMAFNGTQHFEKHELVDYLEAIGMRFGPDLNAYTSFDETVYMLQIPTDSLTIIETAFQILADWSHYITMEDEEIDKERGVVIEEWRLGRGADARMRDQQYPVIFKDSKYAQRLPIGKKEIIETFEHDVLRRFYRDWYRTDLMAVVAVGDIDVDQFENLIHRYFDSIPAVAEPRERVEYDVPGHKETLYTIATDPEATRTSVSVYFKHKPNTFQTEGDYRRSLMEELYNGMLNQRLYELTQQAEPPFIAAYSYSMWWIRGTNIYMLGAQVDQDGVEKGLEALLTEARRVQEHGFTESELQRQKAQLMRELEQKLAEKDKTESRRLIWDVQRHFLRGFIPLHIADEYKLAQKYLDTIDLADINALVKEYITDENRVIAVDGPERDEPLATEDQLKAVFDHVAQKTVEPYEDNVSDQPLVAESPTPGKISSETRIDELDVTVWQLDNGARIILKPTDFKNDEILFSAYSPGGHSVVDDADYWSAVVADDVMTQSGVGAFNRIELDKLLADKVVQVSPQIGELEEGFTGRASPQDLETLFQLVYLYFTAPRQDETAFAAYVARQKTQLENRTANPRAVYMDTVRTTMGNYHPRSYPMTVETLDQVKLDRVYQIFKDRFGDASDFTFLFVGNFELETMKPLVETYLGSLPAQHRGETWHDVGMNPPDGVVKKAVYKGLEPQSMVRMMFHGDFDWNRENRYYLQSMVRAFRIKLREILREDMGGVYGVGVWASPQRDPQPRYMLGIGFGCAPDRVDELTSAVMTQIDSLKMQGLSDIYVEKVQEMQRRERETQLQENNFWLSNLEFYDKYGEDPREILNLEQWISSFNNDKIMEYARRYFNPDEFVQVVLYPEKKTTAKSEE
ncbi:MAG: insulinase family protein [Gemmatimonadetes bacterium]|nr:MAG: insulinase family protein [Gemmatimonadota bacterium]